MLLLPAIEILFLGLARRLVTIPTELYWPEVKLLHDITAVTTAGSDEQTEEKR